jgi:hypothetical protein
MVKQKKIYSMHMHGIDFFVKAEGEVDIKGLTVIPFTSYPFIVSGISLITLSIQ